MKKICITFSLLIAFSAAVSQDGGVELYFGGSSSTFRGEVGDVDISRRFSVQGGFLFLVPIAESFCIKTGLGYSGRGARADNRDIKLNYVELPLLFSFGSEKFDFFAGPQFALLVGSNTSLGETRDFGVKYGVSAGLSESVFTRLTLYHGFSGIDDSPGADVTNRYISLALGYRFRQKAAE